MVEQLLVELLVHGWDLATALGHDSNLEPDIARAALPVVREIYGDLPRTADGPRPPRRRYLAIVGQRSSCLWHLR
ncbi:hypothetical protein ACK8N7_36135 [Streptomyces griseobrunneus]|uniref:hypothetical protein n=1 Tax=Streptomyces microflavus TaxID=1919 RepID=UPI00382B9EEA